MNLSVIGSHLQKTAGQIDAAATLSTPGDGNMLMIQAFAQNVRITLDGTTPTASKGFQLKAADPAVMLAIDDNMTVKVIGEAANATLEYQWFVVK